MTNREFDATWQLATGDLSQRMTPDSKFNYKQPRTWIVGPIFENEIDAKKFLEKFKATFGPMDDDLRASSVSLDES